jgi:tetratricopeptide (TPR) repeat protein
MARAAVKAKQAQRAAAQPAKAAPRRTRGRRKHAGGGNPNQQLFFMRIRRQAKPAFFILAVLFAVTFAFLGIGSGSNSGLDQLFSNLNIFHHGGSSVSKALKEIERSPNAAKGYQDLAAAYQAKGQTAEGISALQQQTTVHPKAVAAWNEVGGLQLAQAQDYYNQYVAAYQNSLLAAPGQSFAPTGRLGTAIGTDKLEQVAAQDAQAALQVLQSKTQLAYSDAVTSFKRVTKLQPRNANAQFQLAQAAQTAGDSTTAVAAYKQYLKLNPSSSSAAAIKKLIKQLSGK